MSKPAGRSMEERGGEALAWLRALSLGAFVAALLGGIALPIYSDEIGWRLQERAALDGVDKLYNQLCGPNTLAHPPFWMMPVRYYSALFNTLFADPLYLRLSGVLYALVWTGMLLLLVRRLTEDARSRTALSTLAIGLVSIGTLPLLLVMSRPEQPILLAFTGAILIVAAGWKRDAGDTPARAAWGRSLIILALALVAMSYHVKAVATAPLFLACIAVGCRGWRTLVPRVVTGAVLTGAALWAGHYWIDRFACPNDASSRALLTGGTGAKLATATDGSQVWPLLSKAFANVSPLQYPGYTAPRADPMSFWLPAGQISEDGAFQWFLVIALIWTLAFIAMAWCLLKVASWCWREKRLQPCAVVSLTLVVTVLGWSALNFISVYEATFTMPMLVIAQLLALATNEHPRFKEALRLAAGGIGIIGVVSIALIAGMFGPSLAAATRQRGYLREQPFSISPFGYPALQRDIVATARKCGIADPAAARRPLVDDVTYFAFMRSRMPEHRFGLIGPSGRDGAIDYLRSIGSSGIVVSCHFLSPEQRARAKGQGQFCCLAPPGW